MVCQWTGKIRSDGALLTGFLIIRIVHLYIFGLCAHPSLSLSHPSMACLYVLPFLYRLYPRSPLNYMKWVFSAEPLPPIAADGKRSESVAEWGGGLQLRKRKPMEFLNSFIFLRPSPKRRQFHPFYRRMWPLWC